MMKISSAAATLLVLGSLMTLIFSNLHPDDATSSATRAIAARRTLAVNSQRALDDMRSTIRDMRVRSKHMSSVQRTAQERELADIEVLLQQTQKQLLIFGAEDEATRRLIEQSIPDSPSLETNQWKSAG